MEGRNFYTLSEAARALGRDRKTLSIIVLVYDVPCTYAGNAIILDADGMKAVRAALADYDRKVKTQRYQFATAR